MSAPCSPALLFQLLTQEVVLRLQIGGLRVVQTDTFPALRKRLERLAMQCNLAQRLRTHGADPTPECVLRDDEVSLARAELLAFSQRSGVACSGQAPAYQPFLLSAGEAIRN